MVAVIAARIVVGAIVNKIARDAELRQIKRDTARIIGGLSLNITSNIDQVIRRLDNIEKQQVPFAISGAINDVLFDVRKQIVGVTGPRSFDIRNRRFLNAALRVKKATKRNLTGAVFDQLGRGHLALHARGGVLRPRGRHLAIPGTDIKGRRGAGGVRKAQRPQAILAKLGKRRAFAVEFKSGQHGIVRRRGKKRLPLKLLYALGHSARIRKTFPFFEDATRVAQRNFRRHFDRRLRQALRTAR